MKIIVTNPKFAVFRFPFVIVIFAPQVLEQNAKHEYKMGQGFALDDYSRKLKGFHW